MDEDSKFLKTCTAVQEALTPVIMDKAHAAEDVALALATGLGVLLGECPDKDHQAQMLQECLRSVVEVCGLEYRSLHMDDLDDEPEERELH